MLACVTGWYLKAMLLEALDSPWGPVQADSRVRSPGYWWEDISRAGKNLSLGRVPPRLFIAV